MRGSSAAQMGRAFTLIELLVVIVIIAILASLALPALSRATGRARKVQCQSDLKQWALAFLQYKDDNEEWIPREGYEKDGKVHLNTWAQVEAVKDPWYNVLPPYLSHSPASAYENPANFDDFYGRPSFFQCPSTRFPKYVFSWTSQFAYFSRAMNSQLITPTTVWRYAGRATIPFGCIVDPTQTPLFMDNRLPGEAKVVEMQEDYDLGQPASEAGRVSPRHLGGVNLVFADGHWDWMRGNRLVGPDGKNVPGNGVLWDLPP